MTTERIDTLVIGGGQAGLAVGYHLARHGRAFVILDAHARIGDAWRRRWDSLRLFTPARYDSLPGMPFPAAPHAFPTKDEMANYLEAYAARFRLPVRTGVRVDALSKDGDWFVATAGALRFEARNVVIAMSAWQRPRVPAFARELRPDIVQLHAGEYQRPSQLRDGAVLVVGAGNSGGEIALDAARGHPTFLAGRDTGNIPFRIGGWPARLILQRLLLGLFLNHIATVRTPIGRKMRGLALRQGMPLIRIRPADLAAAGVVRVPRVTGIEKGLPLLDDGRMLDVSNVVWCTGFSPDLSWMHLPNAVAEQGLKHERGVVADEPGLYVVGLGFIYAASSMMVQGVGRDAEYVVRHLVQQREPASPNDAVASRLPQRLAPPRNLAPAG